MTPSASPFLPAAAATDPGFADALALAQLQADPRTAEMIQLLLLDGYSEAEALRLVAQIVGGGAGSPFAPA